MVLKRYTPPTCTLEITAKSSPLSRWAGQPVFKSLSFELRLDDPRLPDTEHVTLRGDRIQLETLHEAVSTYVQNFLGESRNWESNLNSQTARTAAGPDSPQAAPNAVIFDRAANTSELATSAPNTSYLPVPPRLEPRGLLAHNLFLGSLSAAESGPVVPLSTLQLFDLATALDDCAAEVIALPNLNRESQRPLSSPWLKVAALLVASAGLTTGTIKMLDRAATSPQTATAPAPAPDPGNPQLAAGVSPSPVPALPTPPVPTPAATPALPPLPPPPINTAASPSPSLPPIALAPTPPTNRPSPIQQPPLLFPPNGSAASAPQSAPAFPQGQTITIPAPAEEPPISAPQAPAPVPYVLPPLPPRLAPAVPPPLPPSLSASRFPVPPPQPFPSPIEPIVPPASTELPALEDAQPPAESEDNNEVAASKKNHTLFDTIPQVSEARTYFEERWKPPEGMEQTLEYSVLIDETGSVQSIVPMGKAAADYIEQINMPLAGEPFVSAVSNGKNPKIRVVLRPNGRVQTFLEESD
ncbi:DUF4335 domain-containing protein [Microcoleus vaginatus]|uniref:DUF4335 domain-containing protein n=1 Tax=Microcoleus vaginatus TaxID=119532 RepID=UPI001685493E|nr:DUF4335 domain-containing protein [Microcoleus sp. FACHB-84]MBD2010784.1 DUF4335 domain-containing protein [Microcoleus sp. FACHB-45]